VLLLVLLVYITITIVLLHHGLRIIIVVTVDIIWGVIATWLYSSRKVAH
jgi:hypothetical protein